MADPALEVQIAQEILIERQRQFRDCGHDTRRDDGYTDQRLCDGALAYILASLEDARSSAPAVAVWPWVADTFHPRSPRRNLVKAAAMLIAEVERMDRAAERDG